ncbi:MAG: flagellar M-ring protein FliF [Pedosphaera sp.]|nr:flagellar M-ring protein FliF [Pedosphaera sp.]
MESIKALGLQMLNIWRQLGVNQKVTVAASGLVVLLGLGAVVFFSSRTDFGLLYGKLDSETAGKIIASLDETQTPYKVGQGGGTIYVPNDKVHVTRMKLATQGLPKADGVGYEIFDKPSFGMSDFVQRANYNRALQGELARTISQIDGVESARVMIVAPENRLIIDPTKKPTASVFLKLRNAGLMSSQAVNSVRFIVANSVPGLKYSSVSVVDNFGNTLSANDEEGSTAAMSGTRLAAQRNLERYLTEKVEGMLGAVLGPGQVVVRVSAEINHDQTTKTAEVYDPAGKVERMVQKKLETTDNVSSTPSGTPGTAINTNTSTNQTGNPLTGNRLLRDDLTTEYALSKTTTNTVEMAGNVKRVSAAIFVNKKPGQGGQRADRQPTEIEQLRRVAQNALGLQLGASALREDQIVVEEVEFNDVAATQLNQQLDKDKTYLLVWEIVRSLLYVLLGAGALLAFWKMVRRSAEEAIPTGVTVGQMLSYQTSGGAGMVMPAYAATGVGALPPGAAIRPAGAVVAGVAGPVVAGAPAAATKQSIEEEAAAEEEEKDDVEVVRQEKQKLIMDFGLGKRRPERVNIEVLRDMIRENPEAMTTAARRWLTASEKQDTET